MIKKTSPYLTNPHRLADILAALQVMGTYSWASSEVDKWEQRLGKPASTENWRVIFDEHPEFFRTDDKGVTVRWRYGNHRNFDGDRNCELKAEEIAALPNEKKDKLTRKPLTSEQIETLMKTAIELHNRAIAHSQEHRWMTPLLFTLLGVVITVAAQILVVFLKGEVRAV